jgi:hypothetical protein
MGCNFCRRKEELITRMNYLAPDENEIVLKDYSSPNDALLDIIESKQNFFTKIQLVDFVNLLEQFDIETCGVITDEPMHTNFSSEDEFLDKSMELKEFIIFIETNILTSNDLIVSIKEYGVNFFRTFCIEMFKSLESKLKENKNNNIDANLIKRRNILAFGILFCDCENIEKIKLFFDIFKDEEKNEFTKNELIDEFLISLFLLGSYCIINSRNNLYDEKKQIKKLEKNELLNLYKICELSSCQKLVELFNKTFFKKENYNWQDFKNQFEDIDDGFGWILSSKGIRRKLEENEKVINNIS